MEYLPMLLILVGGYFVFSHYDKERKEWLKSKGGK